MSRPAKPLKSAAMLAVAGGLVALVLGGCAETPMGPTVAVWPAPGKPLEVFRMEDAACRQYAQASIGSNATANNAAAERVALGTALGAAAGLLIGDSGRGVGIGAGMGLLAGSASASQTSDTGSWSLQRRYNIAYEQCMYAKGNQIPGAPQPNYAPPPPPPPPGHGGQSYPRPARS